MKLNAAKRDEVSNTITKLYSKYNKPIPKTEAFKSFLNEVREVYSEYNYDSRPTELGSWIKLVLIGLME